MRVRSTFLIALLSLAITTASADPGDTTIVQTFNFEDQLNQQGDYKSPGRRWFQFPEDDGTTYRKILMHYTLKCFDGGLTAGGLGFPCGEWDYLTYNYLFDHTGVLDSTALTHPRYLLNNQNFVTTTLSTVPQMNFVRHYFETVTDATVQNEATAQSAGDAISNLALRTDRLRNKVQFTYTAQELGDFGLTAGWVGKLAFHVANQSGDAELLRIFVTPSSSSAAVWIENPGQEVFAGPFSPQANAWFDCQLHTPFQWDGTSDLTFTLELTSNTNGNTTELFGDATPSRIINNEASDRYISFDGFDDVRVPAPALATISNEITVAFWVNGDPNIQPAAQTCFEGVNAANQRVVNSHLPWENSRVYWDAGQANGYDRIDKQANISDFEGRWNHWAFTKNASTGEMFIYLNGVLWHSGTDRTRTMEDMVRFSIGAAAGWSNYYNGSIDDFSIWNKALDQATIAAWQTNEITDAHPDYQNLVAYYTFDEPNGVLVNDHSGNSFHALAHGNPDRRLHSARDLFLRAQTVDFRPQIQLTTGDFEVTTETNSFDEEQPVAPRSLIAYSVVGNAVEVSEANYFWEHNVDTYIYNVDGDVIETIAFDGDEVSYTNDTLNYFSVPFEVVDRYEIGRYITPYGIGLTLGADGWTWIFDVTDYEPFLHGMVELEAGNWQELLDMKFVFIEGTPAREVKRVEAFWKGQYNLSTFDQQVTNYTFTPNSDEVNFRLKTRASGHGFGQGNNCAEFCFNMHSVKVNGTTQWSWQIMEECADNPLFPQGGTWIYDRAGWCPGAKVTTQDFELTPFVSGQANFDVDYDITFDPFGDYRMEGQVIAYGPFNFQNDVEIDEVIAPSRWKIHSRKNPVCNKPVIRIRNNGQQPLTSCVFTYGINGETDTFTWTGNLPFGESVDVTLTYNNVNFHSADDQTEIALFSVTVDQPNGQTDEDPSNSTATSTFIRPPLYAYNDLDDNRVIVWINTNNTPWENSVSVETMNGTEVFARSYSQANFNHRDTITLNEGCYVFRFNDVDDDGLSFFANNDGSGSARLKRVGAGNFVQFNPNFGKNIVQHFYFKTNLVSVEEQERTLAASMLVFPNPGSNFVHVSLQNFSPRVHWMVFDLNGRMVSQGQHTLGTQEGTAGLTIPTAHLSNGLYTITVSDGEHRTSERWMKTEN
jgi:hypothetical protein